MILKKIIKKIDKILFFGFLKLIFYKIYFLIQDYSNQKYLKKFKYNYKNNYNYKNTLLSKLADKYGTDKGYDNIKNRIFFNNWHPHNYTDYYSSLFDHTRDNVKKVFECGIGTNNPELPSSMGKQYSPGSSLRMWRDYFPNAVIYGADIDENILFEDLRIKTFHVNQLSKPSIEKMWANIKVDNFDIIIDDGLHTFDAAICLFNNSFAKLKNNGIYIIEDVDPSYLKELSSYLQIKNNIEFVSLKAINYKLLRDNNLIIVRKS